MMAIGERFRLALVAYVQSWSWELNLPKAEQLRRYEVAKVEWDAMSLLARTYWRYRLWRAFGPVMRELRRLEREKAA